MLRALGLGDFLTAVPALRALAGAHPGAELIVAAPEALRPLAELAGVALVHAEPLQPLAPELHEADLLVNLHGRGPQSHAVALAARPRRLIAFAHPDVPETAGMPSWHPATPPLAHASRDDSATAGVAESSLDARDRRSPRESPSGRLLAEGTSPSGRVFPEHEVARWCRLLDESGIPADPSRLGLPAPPLPPELALARDATVIHPGAASAARRWPAERFAAVALAEARAGRDVVVTGGPPEREIAEEVARRAGLSPDVVLAGRTDLAQLAAVIAHAGRVVCGDTGVAHLATAFARPSVLLFGPTSPQTWGPPPFLAGARERHRVLWAGRTGDPHADRPHPGLLEIEPHDVLAELTALPAADDGAAEPRPGRLADRLPA